jgi:acyl-CoA dehydrogenase
MERVIFKEEHEIFRRTYRKFLEKEVIPYQEEWDREGVFPRQIWLKAGEQGFLCPWLPERYGGAGADFLYSAVLIEETGIAQVSGWGIGLHNDIVSPYIYTFGAEAQKEKWLPKCATGEIVTAVAMTEPNCGSDLQALRATAVKDGDSYVLNGQKTFITNGMSNDLVVVACLTDPKAKPRHQGISLIVVEDGTPGYTKVRKLEKIGLKGQDTAELSFEDCRVPQSNRLGEEGAGFKYLMQKLQPERLVVAIRCQAWSRAVLERAIKYCHEREAFGRPIAAFQNTRFKLVEMATQIEVSQAFVDRLIVEHAAGRDVTTETCMAKLFTSEMLKQVADQCLQFYGGYGYMMEYPIAKDYLDARVQTIVAGTSEIMKEVIGRRLAI